MNNKLLSLLQLCDSNFPSGAFSHSFGFETYIQEGKIKNKDGFLGAITTYIQSQLSYCEGLACRFAYEYLSLNQFTELTELDRLLFASSMASETRLGNSRIGVRLAMLCQRLFPSSNLAQYVSLLKEKRCFGHPALVFAIVCHGLSIDKDLTIGAYLYSSVAALIQNGVRGIPLGQTEGQLLLTECQPVIDEAVIKINQLTINHFGAVSPALEIAQMLHEQLHVRLFMS